jgi:hypothetical protein
MASVPALSIRQPWAWLIVAGFKPIENRTWYTRYRGPVLIHASQKMETDAWEDIREGIHPVTGKKVDFGAVGGFSRGGIIGRAVLTNCVSRHDSDWFVGPWGFVLEQAEPLPFHPCPGRLGFFTPEATA